MQDHQRVMYDIPQERREMYNLAIKKVLDEQPFAMSYPFGAETAVHDMLGMPENVSIPSYALIVSAQQIKDIARSAPKTSISFFGQMLQTLCKKNAHLLEQIVEHETVIATCQAYATKKNDKEKENNGTTDMLSCIEEHYFDVKRPESQTNAAWQLSCSLSSPTLDDIKLILENEKRIITEPDLLIDEGLDNLQQLYRPVFSLLGDIRHYDPLLEISNTVPEPFTYALPDRTYLVVPHEGFSIIALDPYSKSSANVMNIFFTEKIIDMLMQTGYIHINKKFGEKNLKAIEDREIIVHAKMNRTELSRDDEKFVDCIKQGKNVSSLERLRFIRDHLQKALRINEDWSTIRKIVDEKGLNYVPPAIKMLFLETADNPIINDAWKTIAAYAVPNDMFKVQRENPELFLDYFKHKMNGTERNLASFQFRIRLRDGQKLDPEVHDYLKKEGLL